MLTGGTGANAHNKNYFDFTSAHQGLVCGINSASSVLFNKANLTPFQQHRQFESNQDLNIPLKQEGRGK